MVLEKKNSLKKNSNGKAKLESVVQFYLILLSVEQNKIGSTSTITIVTGTLLVAYHTETIL